MPLDHRTATNETQDQSLKAKRSRQATPESHEVERDQKVSKSFMLAGNNYSLKPKNKLSLNNLY